MIDAFLDPYVLTLPKNDCSLEQFDEFVESVLSFLLFVREPGNKMLFADSLLEALLEDAVYPYEGKVGELCSQFVQSPATPDDVKTATRTILKSLVSIEEFYRVQDLIFDEDETQILPEEMLQRNSAATASRLPKVLASLAYCLSELPGPKEMIFASREIVQTDKLRVNSSVEGIEIDGDISVHDAMEVRCELEVYERYEEILNGTDFYRFWNNAQNDDSVLRAIELRMRGLMLSGTDRLLFKQIRIGARFRDSLRTWGFADNESRVRNLVDDCAKVGIGLKAGQVMRTDRRRNSPARTRDTDFAVAKRLHVTKSGAGYRLMYWETDQNIEFSNVGDKDELEIFV